MHEQTTLRTESAGDSNVASRVRMQRCRGQAIVEFALVVMPLLILVFALIDFSWVLFNRMNMQDAVHEAARFASTGNHLADPNDPGSNLTRVASIAEKINANKMGTALERLDVSSVRGGAGSAGGPGDTVTVTAVCHVATPTAIVGRLFGGDKMFHFTVSATFKNEPFPPSQTN